VLGRLPIVERQGPAAGGAAGRGDQEAMAVVRADGIAAARLLEDRGLARVGRRRGPFGAHAAGGDRLNRDIGGKTVFEAARVEVATPLPVVVGTRPARQLRPQGNDFRISHSPLPSGAMTRAYGSGAGKESHGRRAAQLPDDSTNVLKIASEIPPGNLYGSIIGAHLFRRRSAASFVAERAGRGEPMYALFWTVAMIAGVLFTLGTAVHRIGALF
jgi:hypothetical protein